MAIVPEELLDKRYDLKKVPLFETVQDWLSKLYLNYFEKDGVRYIKIGKTQYKETVDRVIRNHQAFVEGWDKWVETSMFEYFDKYTPGKSMQNKKEIVEKCEQDILKAWNSVSKPATLPKMNGMSEIFVYSKQLDTIARQVMERNKYRG